jgi:hypothetical protein
MTCALTSFHGSLWHCRCCSDTNVLEACTAQ